MISIDSEKRSLALLSLSGLSTLPLLISLCLTYTDSLSLSTYTDTHTLTVLRTQTFYYFTYSLKHAYTHCLTVSKTHWFTWLHNFLLFHIQPQTCVHTHCLTVSKTHWFTWFQGLGSYCSYSLIQFYPGSLPSICCSNLGIYGSKFQISQYSH